MKIRSLPKLAPSCSRQLPVSLRNAPVPKTCDPTSSFSLPTTSATRILAASAPYHPLGRGLDEFYGFLGGSRQHKPTMADMGPFNTMWRNREKVEETDWSSDIYSKEASDFITRHKDKPFFLYVSYTAPHWPMEVKDEDLAPFAHVEDKHRRALLGLMAGLDRGVGRVLDTLKEHKLDEKTLVIFLSDNGGATGSPRPSPDAPF